MASRRALIGLPCVFLVLQERGITSFDLGSCLVALAVGQFGLELPSGVVSDTYGRRATLIIAGIARVAGWGCFACATSAELAIIGFACMGASFAFDSGSDSAWLYDTLKERNETARYTELEARGQRFGFYALGASSLIGGWVMTLSYDLAVALTVIPLLVSCVAAGMLKEPKIEAKSEDVKFWSNVKEGLHRVWSDKFIFQIVVLSSFAAASLEVYFRFVQQLISQQLGIDPIALGYIYALWLVIAGLSTKLVSPLLVKTRAVVVVRWAVVVLGLALVLLGGGNAPTALVLTAIPQICYALLPVLVRSELNKTSESSVRATILSAFGFIVSVQMALIGAVVGYFADLMSIGAAVVWLGVSILTFSIATHLFAEARKWRERPGWFASLWS